MWQPPYSPDLNICDRWLFQRVKKDLSKQKFENADEVLSAALHCLKQTAENEFIHQIEKLLDDCKLIIEKGGSYLVDGI